MCERFEVKKEGIDYILNFYRYEKYNDKFFLLTLDDGSFLFLNYNSFKQLKKGKIFDEKLYLALYEKGFVINSKNLDDIVEKTRQKYSFLRNGTSLHILILTHRCNMNCSYCFASAQDMNLSENVDDNKNNFSSNVNDSSNFNKMDMDENTARKIVDFVMKSPSKAITLEFQGGEPLIKFNIIQFIVKYANELNLKYKKDLKFALVSNLTLMNDKKAIWLIENNVSICTSFDGPKELHDKNRFILSRIDSKEVGTYDRVVYWIERINQFYFERNIKRKVNGLMTITSYSLKYHKEIIDEYLALNMNFLNIRAMTFIGRATDEENNSLMYRKEDFSLFFEKSLNYIKDLNDNGVRVVERIVELYKKKIILNVPGYHTEYESPCGAATGQITYYIDGKIYTCNEALGKDEFEIGDVFLDKWQDIFKRKEVSKAILNSMIEQNVVCDRCAYKPYCGTCMVENYSRDNKFNFYPTKTQKHFETIYHSRKIFDNILKRENI